ncbi:hypothetical protein E4U21_005955 [Claviceps maximensis]|nr:hypothetical protein E4U21_005955 [Claviceps maximensis]
MTDPKKEHHVADMHSTSNTDSRDAPVGYATGALDCGSSIIPPAQMNSRTRSHTDHAVIGWEVDDPENPHNWSTPKKSWILFIAVMLLLSTAMSSSLPSMAIPNITAEFGISSPPAHVLPISVFLIGYIFGPLIWGPPSEHIGRRNLSVLTFFCFCVFTMGCALAPSWASFLVFRLLCGVFAGSPITIIAGIIADVYGDSRTRGRAFAIFMCATVWGPLFGPLVSGYTVTFIGWRWTFWVGLIFGGFTLCLVLWLPETFGPILLARRAQRMRKKQPGLRVVAPRELEESNMSQLLTVVITRPIRMFVSELIITATCAYLALVFAIFFMFFQAYPIIFRDLYGLSPGTAGLTYLPVGIGSALALCVFWFWDYYLERAQQRGAPWAKREEFCRLPLAVLGGPLLVIGLLWLGVSSKVSVPFVVPMLSGIPFGMGYILLFISLLNYLTDSYEMFAASAHAASSCCRSVLAAVLPLATSHMFGQLGIAGACGLIGGLSAVMCAIPFIFIWKGPAIRARSKFCIALREQKEEMQRRLDVQRARREREQIDVENESKEVWQKQEVQSRQRGFADLGDNTKI